MKPLMQYFSESDCEVNDQSICQSFRGFFDENSQINRVQSIDDQFEQISVQNSQQFSTKCSSIGEKSHKSELIDDLDDLRCSEIDLNEVNTFQPQIKCQCSKSQCQQSYCECFARGKTCNKHCGCQNCQNKQMNKKLKKIQKRLIKQKRNKQRTPRYLKGCTCGKSKCLNKFCSCHQDGKYCNSGCKCVDCKNIYKFSLKSYKSIENVEMNQMEQKNIVQFIIGSENSSKFEILNTLLKQNYI
ncbi:unnamed protein product [Paramecium pentaurelia]|uniref:CRC domain-containing protein n=1 Tax=Paramecium pentaurelia TaxID=43138 RepID=A0A8S1UYL1_9CILI|nr:unnamed protein product [Paramecium pentaurelia]